MISVGTKRLWTYGTLTVVAVLLVANAPERQRVVSMPESKLRGNFAQEAFSRSEGSPADLPEHITRPVLELPSRNPFTKLAQSVPQVAAAPIATPAPAIPAQAAIVPTAPPLGLSFVGRTVLPDMSESIYVSDGQRDFLVKVGDSLPNGYRVEAIKDFSVEFVYPPLRTTAQLQLPQAPKFQIR